MKHRHSKLHQSVIITLGGIVRQFLILVSGLIALSIGSSSFADASKGIVCLVSSVSSQGVAKSNVRYEFNGLKEFSYKNLDIGNLTLEVGVGSMATLASGEIALLYYVEILDKQYGVARAGEVAMGPGGVAQASFQIDGTKEALAAKCALSN